MLCVLNQQLLSFDKENLDNNILQENLEINQLFESDIKTSGAKSLNAKIFASNKDKHIAGIVFWKTRVRVCFTGMKDVTRF